jgi:hypothetical protein
MKNVFIIHFVHLLLSESIAVEFNSLKKIELIKLQGDLFIS